MPKENTAVEAIIEAVPLEVRKSGKVSCITDGVMDALRVLAPAVILAIVSRYGPADPVRQLRILDGGKKR